MVRRVGEAAELMGAAGLEEIPLAAVPPGGRPLIPTAGFRIHPDGATASAPPPRLDEDRAEILAWLAEPVDR